MNCPSWRQDGRQAWWLGPWGPQDWQPGACSLQFCPSRQLHCLSAQRAGGFPSHISGTCTFNTIPAHAARQPLLQCEQGEHLRGASGTWENILELAFLFSTSELCNRCHGTVGPATPCPGPLPPPPCGVVTATLRPVGSSSAGLSVAAGPAPPCPCTPPPDLRSEDVSIGVTGRQGPSNHAVSLLPVVDGRPGAGPGSAPQNQHQTDSRAVSVSHTSHGRNFIPKQKSSTCFRVFPQEGEQLDLWPHGSSWTWGRGPVCRHWAARAKDPRGPCLPLSLRLNLSHFVHWCQRWESFLFRKLDKCHRI